MAAEEYGVKLKVTADTAEAQARMDELLQDKQRRVQTAAGASVTGGVSTDSARRAGRAAGQEFEKTVGKGATGAMIGKAIAGFVLHQAAGSAFAFARTAGADNRSVNRAEGTFSGALQFGTAGFMLGGPYGAAIGGLLGGVAGLVGEFGKERAARQQAAVGRWQAVQASNDALAGSLGSFAQQRLLGWQGSRDARIEWLMANRENLGKRQRSAADALANFDGDQTSKEYLYLQSEFTRLTGSYNAALSAEMRERMTPLYDPYDSSEFSDAFSKRGLSVGPMVDVGTANEKIIEQQGRMVDLLQKIVDATNAGNGMAGQNLNSLLHDIIATTSLR